MALDTFWNESEVKEIASHLQDGRLVELSTSFLMQLKNCSELTDKGGGFGKIYVSRESIPGFKHRLVLKEIGGDQVNNKSQTQLLSSVKNEKLASRVRHYAIVPLLAYHDDISTGKYYLMSPYFENKDLFDALQSGNGDTILLDWKTRLKVIYQIACAIDYMHTPNSFRGTILHLDIKSKNIVLDKKNNARLIDFGLSRESLAGRNFTTALVPGTELYRPSGHHKPSTLLDYYAFGVVIREILTGLCPGGLEPEGEPLGQLDELNFKKLIQIRIWNVDVWKDLSKIADRCISCCHDDSGQLKSSEILQSVKDIFRKEGDSVQRWTALSDNKCEICVVNEQLGKEDSFVDGVTEKYHSSDCPTKIKICCACMRNGYINPVKCQGCDKEIKAIIGDEWGAILIAGYDGDNSFFEKDVKVFAQAISSNVLPSMCVSTWEVIDPASNTERSVLARIYEAFEKMAERNIHTLVFLYSGHHGEEGFKVGKEENDVSIKYINDSLQNCTNIKRVIAFMDCCQPMEIKVSKEQRLIQFNATSRADWVLWEKGKQSYFTKLLVQAFTMKASGGKCVCSGCECCIDGNFITVDKLKNYFEIHRATKTKKGLLPNDPEWFLSKMDWKNEYLAYNYSYKVSFRFEIVLPITNAKHAHDVLATTVVKYQDLIQKNLFPKFADLLGKQLNTQGKYISHTDNDADFLCIVYETGHKSYEDEEVDNIQTLLLAWNSKRLLFCKLRFSKTSHFHKPFGFFLENGKSVQDCIYENGKSVKDYMNEKNEFKLEEMKKFLRELQDKHKKYDAEEKSLTDFISNVSKFINWCYQSELKHRKLKIRFIDLFEECSSCVVHLSLIAPGDHDSLPSKKMDVNSFKNSDSNYPLSPYFYDAMITKTMKDELHDGRLTELPNKMVVELKTRSTTLAGRFGKVYISKDRVPGFNMRVVLKEIDLKAGDQYPSQSAIRSSIINAKLAGRLKHFGIVPLLAYYDDNMQGKYYLLMPYIQNGTLFRAIAVDRINCRTPNDVRLKWHIRIKIMYQIACAIDFMHTGNKFRRLMVHSDIMSKNIVLDSNFNARLIDFGLAREFGNDDEAFNKALDCSDFGVGKRLIVHSDIMSKNIVLDSNFNARLIDFGLAREFGKDDDALNKALYCSDAFNKALDCSDFGFVLLELITGLDRSAKQKGLELRKWHIQLILQKTEKTVWQEHEVEKVAEIAFKCINGVENKGSISMDECRREFQRICQRLSVSKWGNTDESRCEICLINEALRVEFDGHNNSSPEQEACSRRIRICCSCMKNSYINPVKCHTCGETIEPFINASWGAILVAGYNDLYGEVFQKDIRDFREVITSKLVPVMCINRENVITIKDVRNTDFYTQLDQAIDHLSKLNIQTLLFVYSGHHSELGFKVGPTEYLSLGRICQLLNTRTSYNRCFKKVIAFLDTADPPRMELENYVKLIQINPASTALCSPDGSVFLQDVIQAFTMRATGKGCKHEGCKCKELIQGDFITYDDLLRYLNDHAKQGGVRPCIHTSNIEQKDSILAYNCNFTVNVAITLEWNERPSETIHVVPTEFVELKLFLASNVLKHVYGIDAVGSDIRSKFAMAITVEIYTGPDTKDVEEIDNLEMLLHAWNSKRQLICTARLLNNLNVGKPVGRCLKDVLGIRDVHQAVLQKCNIKEEHLTGANLLKYSQQLEEQTPTTNHYKKLIDELIDVVEFQIRHKFKQDTALSISFFDLSKGYTLVYMDLVMPIDDEEGDLRNIDYVKLFE